LHFILLALETGHFTLDTVHWTLDTGSANDESTNVRRDGERALRAKLSDDRDGALQGGINLPIIVCEDVIEATDEANNLPDHVGGSLVDVSHVIYTSGTTGVPKGVVCEHVSLAAYARAKAEVRYLRARTTHGVCTRRGSRRTGPAVHQKCPTLHPEPQTLNPTLSTPTVGLAQAHEIGPTSRIIVPAAHTWDPCIGDITSALAARALVCLAPRSMIVQEFGIALSRSKATHCCTTPSLLALLGRIMV